MGTALPSATIGKNTTFASDRILSAVALESSGTTTSAEFLLAQTLGRTEVRVVANTALVAGSDTLVISVVTADVTGGTFNNTVVTRTVTGSYAAGATLAGFIMPAELEECYTKVTIVSDYDASGTDVDVMTVEV